MKKILYVDNLGADYGSYLLYHGLVNLLGGTENIIDWPYKRTFHGGHDNYPDRINKSVWVVGPPGEVLWKDSNYWRAWQHPERWPKALVANDGPVHFYDVHEAREWAFDEIVTAARSGEIGLIVLASPRWFNSAALHELKSTLGLALPPVVMHDGEDHDQVLTNFIKTFQPKVYFKRTMYEPVPHDAYYGCPVYPCAFGSKWDVPWVPWEERTTDIFCVFGMTQCLRPKVKATVEAVGTRHGLRVLTAIGHPLPHKEYLAAMSRARIVIDHQARGSDTVRTWESLSCGACVFSDMALHLPEPLVPDEHYVRYARANANGTQQDMGDLERRLEAAVGNWDRTEKIARAGWEQVRAKHTTVARARFVLKKAQDFGIDTSEWLATNPG